MRFLCEFIVNLNKVYLTGVRKTQFVRFLKQMKKLTEKTTTLNSRRLILSSKAGLKILGCIYQLFMKKLSAYFNEWVQKVFFCSKRTVGEQEQKATWSHVKAQ